MNKPTAGTSGTGEVSPPIAKRIPKRSTLHGEERVDYYDWLREKSDPEVRLYLEAENAYANAVLAPAGELQEKIYREILGRIKQTDVSAPYRRGAYWYYRRTEEGKQYGIYCRKYHTLDAAEEVLLDLNILAEGHSFMSLGVYQVSDDGTLLAYSIDKTGFREYELFVKNLSTGEVLPDRLGNVGTVVWGSDNRTLFYVREDRAKRPYRFYRHELGKSVEDDALLYEERDALYRIWTRRSRDRKLILLESGSAVTSEARFLRNAPPFEELALFLEREEGHEYDIDHREGVFYVRTNKHAKNFRLVTAAPGQQSPSEWKELVPHRDNVKLEDFLLFKDHAVFFEYRLGLPGLIVHDFASGERHGIEFHEPVYSVSPGVNAEYDTAVFRYEYESFVTPLSVYDYNMMDRSKILVKETEVLGGYQKSDYHSERLWCRASDGTDVPISLVSKKGITRDGRNPLLLHAYGAYGMIIPVNCSIPRLSLLDRGVIYAFAHVRGGGDLGEGWREGGRMMNKKNTFTDFIACAEYLIEQQYTGKEHLAIQGGSAGGLLVGAVLNMRPELFRAAHLAVPFVDVLNTMLDESLPLTVGEFLEWGNPKERREYDYIKSYCPYTNLHAGRYPSILVTASLNDSQVMYWEPAKYVAKLRSITKGNTEVLLKTNMGAGHGGASGRYDALREQAMVLSFLLTRLGITQ